MFELISAILFSISANIDNIAIGISYGVKKTHISLCKNILICVITSLITFFSMYIGQNIFKLINIKLASSIGALMLIIIGIYPIFKKIIDKGLNLNRQNNNNSIYKLKNSTINISELLIIIFSLSLNNIAAGIAASVTGINILCTAICTLIFGSIFLYIGNNLGKKINNKLIKNCSEFISSFILILIGILELFI